MNCFRFKFTIGGKNKRNRCLNGRDLLFKEI